MNSNSRVWDVGDRLFIWGSHGFGKISDSEINGFAEVSNDEF